MTIKVSVFASLQAQVDGILETVKKAVAEAENVQKTKLEHMHNFDVKIREAEYRAQ